MISKSNVNITINHVLVFVNYLSSEFHRVQSSIERQIAAGQQRLRESKAIDEQPVQKDATARTFVAQKRSIVPAMMRSSLELNCDTRWFLPLRSVIETWRRLLARRWASLGRTVSIPCLERRHPWVWKWPDTHVSRKKKIVHTGN